MLYEKAPAKINLTLDVLGKRPDGFHEVEMVMTTIDLSDRIGLRSLRDDRIELDVSEPYIPTDERNLAYQAARLMKETYHISTGVYIRLEKTIPVAAGLAGGSTDAAAVLRGLNKLWDIGATPEELAALGATLGSDVPFCVHGGTAIATGRGEQLNKVNDPPNCWVILAKPPLSVSTATIYSNVNLDDVQHPKTEQMIRALELGDYESMCQSVGNALESVTMSLYSEVRTLKSKMERFGVDAALMSGSGPTVFGFVKQEARVQRILNGLRGFCPEVYAVRIGQESFE